MVTYLEKEKKNVVNSKLKELMNHISIKGVTLLIEINDSSYYKSNFFPLSYNPQGNYFAPISLNKIFIFRGVLHKCKGHI